MELLAYEPTIYKLLDPKKLYPELFVAAWNPGSGPEPDGIFSGLMKDGTFNIAMFETYTHYPGELVHPGGEFQVRLTDTSRQS